MSSYGGAESILINPPLYCEHSENYATITLIILHIGGLYEWRNQRLKRAFLIIKNIPS